MRWLVLLGISVLTAGCSDRATTSALGARVEGPDSPIRVALATNAGADIVLRGTMTKKCPTAGCWFVLKDETGTIKVDTKSAGFVVVDVPVNSLLLVSGRVATNGTERMIDAHGVRSANAP